MMHSGSSFFWYLASGISKPVRPDAAPVFPEIFDLVNPLEQTLHLAPPDFFLWRVGYAKPVGDGFAHKQLMDKLSQKIECRLREGYRDIQEYAVHRLLP